MPVSLAVDPQVKRLLPSGMARRLAQEARQALLLLARPTDELSIRLVDDDSMADLNQRYRNRKGPTDVLSFPQQEGLGARSALLGDLVISVETAARRRKRPLDRELLHLCLHGLLHLTGFDHATRSQARAMFALERSLMQRIVGAPPRGSRR